MQAAVNKFQKNLFILLLYVSGYSGVFADIAMSGSKTLFYLIFDAVIIFLSLLSLSFLRSGLVYIVFFLIACFIFNISYSEASVMASLNGIREILILISLVIFYNKIFSQGEEVIEEYVEIMRKYAVVFLALQIPVALVQFLQHGPSDWVGGTYGNMGSGVLTLAVICLVFFLFPYMKTLGQKAMLYATLLPLLMNETKVSFILIPMAVMFMQFQPKLKNILLAAGGAFVFLLIFNQYYSHTNSNEATGMGAIFSSDFIDSYLFGDIYYSDDVPRFTKIIVSWQLLSHEQLNTFLFGFEYGLFKGGNVVESTRLAQTYQWLLTGTRPYLFFLLIQGGVMLVAGLILMLAYINKFFREGNKFKTFLFIIFLIMLCYNDAFRNQGFCTVYFFLVFYANSTLYPPKVTIG